MQTNQQGEGHYRIPTAGEGGSQTSSLCEPWLLIRLVLTVCSYAGIYYGFWAPAATEIHLRQDLGLDDDDYSFLQSLYATPNIILPLFGGLFIARVGTQKALVVLGCLVVFGQVIYNLGILYKDKSKLFYGRGIFGIGGESLCVTMHVVVAEWFVGTTRQHESKNTQFNRQNLSRDHVQDSISHTRSGLTLGLAMGPFTGGLMAPLCFNLMPILLI